MAVTAAGSRSRNSAVLAGGAVAVDDPTNAAALTNSILWGDTASSGGEIALIGSGQVAVSFCDVQGGYPGSSNLDADPLFDPARPWHLLACSPCRNTGDTAAPNLPDLDVDDDVRVAGGVVDIGADEWVECVSFRDIGPGLAGSGGFIPSLAGTDGSCRPGGNGNCTGPQYSLGITQGLADASGYLWASLGRADFFPFHGGHFYIGFAAPWTLVPVHLGGPAGQPGAGSLALPSVDLSVYGPVDLFLQGTFLDPGSVDGVSLTDGLRLRLTN